MACNFYPRSPCGERQSTRQIKQTCREISIHALLAESDYDASVLMKCQVKFLSTLSLRRATVRYRHISFRRFNFYPRSPCGERPDMAVSYSKGIKISIHALLAESDLNCLFGRYGAFYFYPRSPCGERLSLTEYGLKWLAISIHALLAESDNQPDKSNKPAGRFLSTLSLRRATVVRALKLANAMLFLSTLSLRRATARSASKLGGMSISIHALLAESDR